MIRYVYRNRERLTSISNLASLVLEYPKTRRRLQRMQVLRAMLCGVTFKLRRFRTQAGSNMAWRQRLRVNADKRTHRLHGVPRRL
ncbi:hypothetical protein OE88DRAFT_1661895 [Heliocybe sulcata]|uniref:Uncharacterized protein n=1 Tax=Heliocybe sulcata TaxID=5364 RepID=A0A5C3N2C5_9AGAM|nr:hypothetical protein OE88DRAFT_1661895 [Heliocybe sulcata]